MLLAVKSRWKNKLPNLGERTKRLPTCTLVFW